MEEKKKPGTWYTALSNAATIGLLLSVGILVVGFLRSSLSATVVLVLSILTILFGGCALSLVWVRNLERKRFAKLSIAFLAMTAVCCVLWIGCAICIYSIFKNPAKDHAGDLNFIKIALVVTLQFAFANVITRNIIKYKKSVIPFQIVYYLSCIFVDLYFSLLACSIHFKTGGDIGFSKSVVETLFSGVFLTIFILACVYIVVANSVLNSIEKKRTGRIGRKSLFDRMNDDPEFEEDLKKKRQLKQVAEKTPEKDNDNVKERLDELKKLYDEKIITEEEYNKKRSDILEEL